MDDFLPRRDAHHWMESRIPLIIVPIVPTGLLPHRAQTLFLYRNLRTIELCVGFLSSVSASSASQEVGFKSRRSHPSLFTPTYTVTQPEALFSQTEVRNF